MNGFKSELSVLVEQFGEAIKNLHEGQKQYDNAVKNELNIIKQEIEEG